MECNSPFSDYISNCQTALIVNAHLTPTTNYIALIKDKFDKVYSVAITTDISGNFQIPIADLPDGLLNNFAGTFVLSVVQLYSNAPVDLKMMTSYEEIFFDIKGGTQEKDNLGIA